MLLSLADISESWAFNLASSCSFVPCPALMVASATLNFFRGARFCFLSMAHFPLGLIPKQLGLRQTSCQTRGRWKETG
jgi:hypothetical protein